MLQYSKILKSEKGVIIVLCFFCGTVMIYFLFVILNTLCISYFIYLLFLFCFVNLDSLNSLEHYVSGKIELFNMPFFVRIKFFHYLYFSFTRKVSEKQQATKLNRNHI